MKKIKINKSKKKKNNFFLKKISKKWSIKFQVNKDKKNGQGLIFNIWYLW